MAEGTAAIPGGAFSGVRVLEVADGIAAPYATRLLADQGAQVTKLEPPEGDWYRSEPGFQALNRNKRSAAVADPTAITTQLAPDADLVVTSSPQVAAAVASVAPNTVVLSMPSVPSVAVGGSDEAALPEGPLSPGALAAVTGIAWTQLSYAEAPVHVVLPLASYGAAMLGAVTAAAGLYARACGAGAGRYEVSEVAGAGAMQSGFCTTPETGPIGDGSSPLGSAGRAPAYRLFRCADDLWMFVACGTPAFYEAMLRAVGRADLLGHPELVDPPWGLLDDRSVSLLTPELEAAFGSRTRADWLELLASHDVPCAPVQSREEFLASPLAEANELDATVEHPEMGTVTLGTQPFQIDGCPAAAPQRAPLVGEHTGQVLAEAAAAGAVAADVTQQRDAPSLTQEGTPVTPEGTTPPTSPTSAFPADVSATTGAPLAGIHAIDLSSFIAGPVISRHLAMLGAEVVKVEPPAGDPFRVMGPLFNGWNQGKRGISLDLKSEADRTVLYGLVARSDVVVENFRPGVAERLGCSAEQLRAANPQVVLARSNGYGNDASMASVAAFDPLLQALGGAMAAQGGDDDPVFLSVPIHDTTTPLLACFGLVAGLYRKATNPASPPATVRTSLTQSTAAIQAAEMVRYAGRSEPEVGGFDHPGPGEHARFELDEADTANGGSSSPVPAGPAGWHWVEHADGETRRWPVTGHFTSSPLATEAGLVTTQSTEFGEVTCPGQLVVGCDVQLGPAPCHDEHGDRIRQELAANAV